MINWEKKGLILNVAKEGFTHASHPSMIHISNDKYLLAFSSRKNKQSHIFFSHAKIENDEIKIISENNDKFKL